ncbi:hypothetical protein [Actinoplanes auranticolor]|uniref:hypothetical protein n=1 Tax=Actinoplanes auranticolor TaxID=47988 RepID=UPI001BB41B14|nr:hypothetical protein [Actinoplanes auranticolor]
MYDSPQPSWGAPPPPPPGPGYQGSTAIAVTARYSWLTFMLALFKPYLAINGQPVAARWGRTVVPVPPGQHHVHVHVPYLLPSRIGTADTVVPVHPGQVAEVEYRAPAIALLDGAIGPAPQKYRGLPAAIALVVVPLVLLLCVCGGLGAAALIDDSESGTPVARPTAVEPIPARPRTTEPSPGATGAVPSDKPTLRSAPVRKLVGPAYAAGEDTYTMAFAGWPFAFRTPGTWGCLAGRIDLPEAQARVCIDEGNPGSGQRLQIMLRPCPAPCGEAERDRLTAEWFDPGAKGRAYDKSTWYVETPTDAKGRYTLDMSHFFTTSGGAWQVGVGAFAPPAKKTVIQKIFNDVLTQTG